MTPDRLSRLAYSADLRSDSSAWVAAFACAQILRQGGDLRGLASVRARDRSTLYRMAAAWEVYDELRDRSFPVNGRYLSARQVRRSLTVKHFYRIGEVQRRYDLTLEDVVQALADASESRTGAAQMAILVEQMEGDYDTDRDKRLITLRSRLEFFMADGDETLQRLVESLWLYLERIIKDGGPDK